MELLAFSESSGGMENLNLCKAISHELKVGIFLRCACSVGKIFLAWGKQVIKSFKAIIKTSIIKKTMAKPKLKIPPHVDLSLCGIHENRPTNQS